MIDRSVIPFENISCEQIYSKFYSLEIFKFEWSRSSKLPFLRQKQLSVFPEFITIIYQKTQ